MSLPSGASPWNGIFGRVEGQNTTAGGGYNQAVSNITIEYKYFKQINYVKVRIDKMQQRLHKQAQSRMDYSHQKQYRQTK